MSISLNILSFVIGSLIISSTGDMLGTILTDVFSDINIYDDDIRLLQRRFVSPIGRGAIRFYKYYLMDTLMVDRQECVCLLYTSRCVEETATAKCKSSS